MELKARDIMTTEVLSVGPDTSVLEAIDILVDNQISGMPIVDENNNVIGVVTEKDLLITYDFMGSKDSSDVTVEVLMTKEVISFPEDAEIKDIMNALVRNNIKRVPIIRDNKVIGIVARRDILKIIRNG